MSLVGLAARLIGQIARINDVTACLIWLVEGLIELIARLVGLAMGLVGLVVGLDEQVALRQLISCFVGLVASFIGIATSRWVDCVPRRASHLADWALRRAGCKLRLASWVNYESRLAGYSRRVGYAPYLTACFITLHVSFVGLVAHLFKLQ